LLYYKNKTQVQILLQSVTIASGTEDFISLSTVPTIIAS
ncbi:hypothetical protein T11_5915, partial [Trichinella zimbabwensis]